MMLSSQKLGCSKVAPFGRRPARRALCVAAKSQASQQDASLGRRNFLTALGFFGTITAAQAAQAAAGPYEELKKISAARGGEGSLLERFESTRTAVASTKADRGIRDKLASEASNAPKPKPASTSGGGGGSFNLFGGSSSGPKPAAPKPLPPRPPPAPTPAFAFAPKPAAAPAAVKPAAAAPKPAATAAAGAGASFGGAVLGPVAQAVGVLGAVAVGANAVTSFATSNKKGKARPASPAAAAAPAAASAAAASSTKKVSSGSKKLSSGTAKKVSSSTAKVAVSAPAAAAAVSSTKKVVSSTKKVAKRAPVAAAAATGTVRDTIKKALVNEEQPDEPTDFAVAGFLGFAGLLAAFFLFGLPEPIPSGPSSSSTASDPLVEAAKEAAARAGTPAYTTPLYKAQSDAAVQAPRKEIVAAAAKPAPAVVAVPVPVPVPAPAAPEPAAVVEAPAPAPAPAPAAKPAPAVVQKAVEPKNETPAAPAAAASEAAATSGPNNLAIVGGSLALIVAAFAAVGGNSSEQSANGTTPAEGSSSGNGAAPAAAAYEKAVNALFADPDTADELYGIIAPALRNGPALAWALVSNQTNAETLDGWAFQKLPTSKYQRVRQLLSDMGLPLPDTPKPQPTMTAFGADTAAAATAGTAAAAAAAAGSAELDPEKLRAVFEALLGNPASRTLMRKLLAGAGMPFDEAAFEEQIKDAAYFNLAIAPILRKMPPQKLAVLADLQDPAKLRELVSTVSNLASDNTQLDAVTAELSGDVRNTVQKIREDSQAGTASSGR